MRDRDHARGIKRGHIWTYLGDGGEVAFCEYTPDWKGTWPQTTLAEFRGRVIQSDGYAGLAPVFARPDGPRRAGCMDHCRRRFVKALDAGDHNEERARKMDELGLTPSSTGALGGEHVGYRMSHFIVEGGAFARAFEAMPREYLLPWTCWEPQGNDKGKSKPRASKLKYTCPTCAANAWGKPGLLLRCGECDETMMNESEDCGAGDAGQSALQAA